MALDAVETNRSISTDSVKQSSQLERNQFRIATGPEFEFLKKGNQREVIVYHTDFNKAHALAYQIFVKNIASEIKAGNLTMSGFETEIGKKDGKYFVIYRIKLNPAPDAKSRHTVVDIRGTVLSGESGAEAKKKVGEANEIKWHGKDTKGKDWVARMKDSVSQDDSSKKIWEETASHSFKEGDFYWHHEAKLIKGN